MPRKTERFRARPVSRRRLTLALVVGGVAAALAGVSIWLVTSASARTAAPSGPVSAPGHSGATSGVGVTSPNGPTGGVDSPPPQVAIGKFRKLVPYVPLPNSPLANDGNAGPVLLDSRFDPRHAEVFARVSYTRSGIELLWGSAPVRADFSGHLVIGGVPAALIKMGAPDPALFLQVLPTRGLFLWGPVSKTDLISVAKTLSVSPGSPDASLPPSYVGPPQGARRYSGLQLIPFKTGVLLDAVSADSVAAAAGSLAFRPVAPPALGHPSAVVYTNPTSARASDRVLSLRYSDPSMGRFWLLERPSLSTTTSLLRGAVSQCSHVKGHRTCVGSASMLDLGHGVQALSAFIHDEGKQIVWVEGGVYFKLIGPMSTFSDADALSVARTVAAAAAG